MPDDDESLPPGFMRDPLTGGIAFDPSRTHKFMAISPGLYPVERLPLGHPSAAPSSAAPRQPAPAAHSTRETSAPAVPTFVQRSPERGLSMNSTTWKPTVRRAYADVNRFLYGRAAKGGGKVADEDMTLSQKIVDLCGVVSNEDVPDDKRQAALEKLRAALRELDAKQDGDGGSTREDTPDEKPAKEEQARALDIKIGKAMGHSSPVRYEVGCGDRAAAAAYLRALEGRRAAIRSNDVETLLDRVFGGRR